MPNTLAHIGVQTIATRGVARTADIKWIFLGAMLADVPWILQRVARALPLDLPPLDLRLYAIVQASLFGCLLLAAALAAFSVRPWRVFATLAAGSLMHLLLDATQIKWGNGVHLLAPFSWELTNFGLFWPESSPTIALTALGLVVVVYVWWRLPAPAMDLAWPRGRKLALTALAGGAYLALPLALLSGPEAADNHSTKVLREVAARPGQAIAFDRRPYVKRADGDALIALNGEALTVANPTLDRSGTVSARAVFIDERTIRVDALFVHWGNARDIPSYFGLAVVLAAWLRCLLPLARRRLAAASR